MVGPLRNPETPRECVLLIHGLGESELRMFPLSFCLKQKGYRTLNTSYPSTRYPTEQLAEEYIAPLLHDCKDEDTLHVVTHSMGGILLRYCLQSRRQENLKRVVMLAPAHQGSEILEIYRHNPLFHALYGPVTQQSGKGRHCFSCTLQDKITYELGIIAGCLPLDPLSLPVIPWPHDGRTSVEGTKLPGMKDHLVIPASHEFTTYHPLAIYQTLYFLEYGEFNLGA